MYESTEVALILSLLPLDRWEPVRILQIRKEVKEKCVRMSPMSIFLAIGEMGATNRPAIPNR
jgi:hypothetical protein